MAGALCLSAGRAGRAPRGRRGQRRQGLGEQLTRWRLERLHRSGDPVHVSTSARSTASLALHARLGLVEVGRAASYLGEPFTGGVGVLVRWRPAEAP